MNYIVQELRKILREDQKDLVIVRKRLERKKNERIRVRKNRGHTEFYLVYRDAEDGKRHEKYVPASNAKLLASNANLEYAELAEPILSEEIFQIENFLATFQPERKHLIPDTMAPELAVYVNPVCKTGLELAKEWASDMYQRNSYPISPGNAYESQRGDIVRSRAECLAVNTLFNLDLPYRYESVLELDERGDVYPDITVMHPVTLELWYIEIFGMMGDIDYAREAFDKIRRYQRAGLGGHLLAFFDYPDVPFDPAAFERTIRAIFQPD